MLDQQILDYMGRIDEIVDRSGWMVQGVFPTVDDPEPHQPWEYTIGLSPAHPEMMLRGLSAKQGQVILNILADKALDGSLLIGKPMMDVLRPTEDGRSLPVLVLRQSDAVPDDDWGMGINWHEHHGRDDRFERLSVLWPDAQGRLPTDDDCDPQIAYAQRPW